MAAVPEQRSDSPTDVTGVHSTNSCVILSECRWGMCPQMLLGLDVLGSACGSSC